PEHQTFARIVVRSGLVRHNWAIPPQPGPGCRVSLSRMVIAALERAPTVQLPSRCLESLLA
ncbi:MAG TPA: hypothetical protein VLA19_02400, partial [Herpetosiphonaceae bacterium]|nr:hypothetical protein [Herpetosiphonaceae bacterium]